MAHIPEGRKMLSEDVAQRQVDGIKHIIDRLAVVTYAPHNTPQDDEEMERLVYEYAPEAFKAQKNRSREARLTAMLFENLKSDRLREELQNDK